jgi:hypothetical protein
MDMTYGVRGLISSANRRGIEEVVVVAVVVVVAPSMRMGSRVLKMKVDLMFSET